MHPGGRLALLRARPYATLAALVAFVVAYWRAWGTNHLGTNDTTSALLPAWSLVHHGHLAVPIDYIDQYTYPQMVIHNNQLYSNRPLGMILSSIPGEAFYAQPSLIGIALSAAVVSALTVWLAYRLWGASACGLVAFCTPVLYVVGRTLWPEAVCVPALLAGLLAIRHRQSLWVLLPLVMYITMCRPPFGLLALAIFAIRLRTWKSRIWPGAGLVAGIAALYLYSHLTFGTWTLTPGYPRPHVILWRAVWQGLISPARGVLFWTPWILFARPRGRRDVFVVTAAGVYVIASWLSYGAFAGLGWPGYRYPIPLVVLLVPMLVRPAGRLPRYLYYLAIVWSAGLGIVAESLDIRLGKPHDVWAWGLPTVETVAVLVCVALLFGYYRLRIRPELARRKQAREPVGAAT